MRKKFLIKTFFPEFKFFKTFQKLLEYKATFEQAYLYTFENFFYKISGMYQSVKIVDLDGPLFVFKRISSKKSLFLNSTKYRHDRYFNSLTHS